VRTARAQAAVGLDPDAARSLWTDVLRWPSFVEGFARVLELSDEWPGEGAKLVWESIPAGRGRVTERARASDERSFATEVFDDSLHGTQTATFEPVEGGTRVQVELEYELVRWGPLRALADVLFIRRAVRDSLRRTLGRYAVEAEEEAGLR
jgi:polyketide cyclase/dehydrase/lipid transport protein